MVQHGKQQLAAGLKTVHAARQRIDEIPGLHVLHGELIREEVSHDLYPFHVLIDVTGLGISGYQAADWLRHQCGIDMGVTDSRHTEATFSRSDDEPTATRLIEALGALKVAAPDWPHPLR